MRLLAPGGLPDCVVSVVDPTWQRISDTTLQSPHPSRDPHRRAAQLTWCTPYTQTSTRVPAGDRGSPLRLLPVCPYVRRILDNPTDTAPTTVSRRAITKQTHTF
jgi:hypothetical protein